MGIAIALLLKPSIVAIIKMMILPSKPETAFTNSMVEAFYALRQILLANQTELAVARKNELS
jgi:hypothetical protein